MPSMTIMLKNQSISVRFIEMLLHSTHSSAHLKDIVTGKYLDSNTLNVKKFGLTKAQDIIGLTINDVDTTMQPYWGKNLASDIKIIEKKVIDKKIATNDKRPFLTANGKVFVHDMVKIPILGQRNQVIALYTTSDEITDQLELTQLFHLYLTLFSTPLLKKHVIRKYLEHINIADYFFDPPTKAEVRVLITKLKYPASKMIANALSISPRTVHSHIEKLQAKTDHNLNNILPMIKIIT